MTKNDTVVIREGGHTGTFVTLPGGRRVHTLNRSTFERAVQAANDYIVEINKREGRPVIQRLKNRERI
jgi:hypothetical protein